MATNKAGNLIRSIFGPSAAVVVSVALAVASCSSPEPAKINPVTGGGRGAITKKPAREDLAVMVNGKKWDGQADVDSLKYQVVGE
jgi:hypothetical protein